MLAKASSRICVALAGVLVTFGIGACASPVSAPPAVSGPKTLVSDEAIDARLPVCPTGTVLLGLAPPDGFDAQCKRPESDGSFVAEGPGVTWYEDGAEKERGVYVAGQKQGVWRMVHPNGNKAREESWVAGVREGASMQWSADGQLKSERSYRKGKQEGVERIYYTGGILASERSYRAGQPEGESSTWFANRSQATRGSYRAGAPDGFWTYWYSSGEACLKGRYERGRRVGGWIHRTSTGKTEVAEFAAGELKSGTLIEPEVCT